MSHANDWTRLTPQEIERQATHIAPGAWRVDDDKPMATLLGSCVAVCLFDPVLRIGGMNHFMLPTMARGDTDSVLSGDFAMEILLNGMLTRGARRERIEAKVFGAGAILNMGNVRSGSGIGERNAAFAREWLLRENVLLKAADLLGPWSRKVLFVPQTGDAWCRRMSVNMATTEQVAREEARYAESLRKRPPTTDVELF